MFQPLPGLDVVVVYEILDITCISTYVHHGNEPREHWAKELQARHPIAVAGVEKDFHEILCAEPPEKKEQFVRRSALALSG